MERTCIKADVGVVIGRFQVPSLHAGHEEILDWMWEHYPRVIVVLGVPAVPVQRDNPLDFEARALMLHRFSAERNKLLTVIPLRDCRSNAVWSLCLDQLVQSMLAPGQKAVLCGSRDSFLPAYDGCLSTQELVGDAEHWSGTLLRRGARQAVRPGEDFRAGVIWAVENQYHAVHPTVDIVVTREGRWLMIRKLGEPGWRFVGGHADPTSATYEDDAIREVREEVCLEVHYPVYRCSLLVDDWRYPGKDKVKTLVFTAESLTGRPEVEDDVRGGECRWFDPSKLCDDMLVPEHRPILAKLVSMDLAKTPKEIL